MRVTDASIRSAAAALYPYLSAEARTEGCLTDSAIHRAMNAARSDGVQIPMFRSKRSLDMIESFHVNGY